MARYFDRVEDILQVQPTERQYLGPIVDIMARGCDALGYSHIRVLRNAPGCNGSGFCDFGCRTDARRSTNISYIPPALEKGAVLLTGLRAERILIEDGRAVGIEGTAKDGRKIRVRARAVIFSGGAIPTPLFLLKQGICNQSGQVGRNLTLHPSGALSAIFDDDVRGYDYVPQGSACDHFLRDGILITSAQPDVNFVPLMFPFAGRRLMNVLDQLPHIGSLAVLIADATRKGRVWFDVGGLPAVTYNLSREDTDRMHRGLVYGVEICRAAGARKVYPTVLGWPVIQTESDVKNFREARLSAGDIPVLSYHPLGTCKMGKDPKNSVVGLDHQAHDLPGLYIVDGSTVPGPLGVNPQVTIMAMATRAATEIAQALA